MSKFKVLRPIAFGGRKEVGDIIELSKEQESVINPSYIVPVGKKAQQKWEENIEVKPEKKSTKKDKKEDKKQDIGEIKE